MTARVINLNHARKDRAKAADRAAADANAARHGRTKAEKAREKAEAEAAARRLDGHLRETD